nr:hypothetical protein [Bradyrhizobium sp. SUTN9-2]
MRFIVLSVLALLALPAVPASAQSDRAIADRLPLFARNNCQPIRDPGNQLFCGDAALAAAAEKLSIAIEERLARLPDRLPAIEENAIWVRQRNLSCGIVGQTAIRPDQFETVKACLLKVTEERAAIVRDPDFDCLAANTAAGAVICADPSLTLAETELNGQVLGLIGNWTRLRHALPSPNMDGGRASATANAIWSARRTCRCRSWNPRRTVSPTI